MKVPACDPPCDQNDVVVETVLSCDRLETDVVRKLNSLKPFSVFAIEQDTVLIRFPDGRQLEAARTMQAKVNAARFASSN